MGVRWRKLSAMWPDGITSTKLKDCQRGPRAASEPFDRRGGSNCKYSPKAWNLEELVWRGLEEFSNAGHHECLASPN